MKMRLRLLTRISALFLVVLFSCEEKGSRITIESGDLTMVISDNLQTQILSKAEGSKPLTAMNDTEYLQTDLEKIGDFDVISVKEEEITNELGKGTSYTITGENNKVGIKKTLIVKKYDNSPDILSTKAIYTNESEKDVLVKKWVNNGYKIIPQGDTPPFWAFQGSSSGERKDWIKPIEEGYFQQNFMGMNSSDYGGGIPITDIWRSDAGIAVGHLALTPKILSLPTEMKMYESEVSIGVSEAFDYPYYFSNGDEIETEETFVMIHTGDYYNALKKYTEVMQTKGIQMPEAKPEAFEPIWCAWGYERNFTLDEVIGTLPKVKEMGIKWAVLDDGFQIAEGDWTTNKNKFPGGNAQMKAFVDKIHGFGMKAKLWWAPLAADPTSQLLADDPDMRLYLSDWAPQFITWWDAYYLSPTQPKTIAHTKEVVNMFMNEWGFDGLKLDGQHMNAVAPDHNPASNLDDPNHAHEKLPEFFKIIYDEALKIKPNAVVENCPCGTCMSYHNMPYMNQAVSSDPVSSWQIRLKGKTYKALIPNTAYYGDHVELSDGGEDFASSFGVGAVLGTKFTWPKDNPTTDSSFLLTPEREKKWKKWFGLYNEKMLSKEMYLGNLYDIGYDKPETHVIVKGDIMHYAFYDEDWSGAIELRGLADKTYVVRDYFNDKIIGEVTGPIGNISCDFKDFLLIEVSAK